jgi:hypothetical protein
VPDIAELLAAAARRPVTDVDVAAVARRGRVLRRRRQGGIAVAALVALAVPAGLLASGGGSGGEDHLVPLPGVTSTPAIPTPAPDRTGGGTGVVPSSETTRGPVADSASPLGAPPRTRSPGAGRTLDPTATPTIGASTTPAAGADLYPVRRTCTVSTTRLAPGRSQTCRFTAAAAGGWKLTYNVGVFAGDYQTDVRIVVRRGQRTWTYDDDCGSNLIRPGDRVTITIQQFDSGYADHTLTAGAGYSC